MLGMVEGNHPYSWSIIFNGGYDRAALDKCPHPGIRDYIVKQPPGTLGIDGARVARMWTDNPADAEDVARVALVPHVMRRPEDVIGHVDAVLVYDRQRFEHVERARRSSRRGCRCSSTNRFATTVPISRRSIAG